jgi:hypothetical protein
MLPGRPAVALLSLVTALVTTIAACGPAPTPSPTSTVTFEQAAEAYRSFTTGWSAANTDALNAAASAADADPAKVAAYAATVAASYSAFIDGIRSLDMPESVLPAVQAELETLTVVVGLARQLNTDPADVAVRSELQGALARLARASANVEALLGISR